MHDQIDVCALIMATSTISARVMSNMVAVVVVIVWQLDL